MAFPVKSKGKCSLPRYRYIPSSSKLFLDQAQKPYAITII